MLDLMWVRGHVGISRREGAQRVWDLMDALPARTRPTTSSTTREVTRRAAPLAIKALGAGRVPHIRNHFIRGRYPHLPQVLDELQQPGHARSASRSKASATTGGSTPTTSRR